MREMDKIETLWFLLLLYAFTWGAGIFVSNMIKNTIRLPMLEFWVELVHMLSLVSGCTLITLLGVILLIVSALEK